MRKIVRALIAGASLTLLTAVAVAHASPAAAHAGRKPVAASPAPSVKIKKPKPAPKPEVSTVTASFWGTSPWRFVLDDSAGDEVQTIADMDRQMAAMLADLARLQPDAEEPTIDTIANAGALCGESIVVTQIGAAPPRVERRVYGNCARQGEQATLTPSRPTTDGTVI